LACGSTDFKVRVFSGFIKDIEERPSETPWGKKMPIGQLMAEFSNSPMGGGWVHGVSFSHDGDRLAWIAHDASINIADAKNGLAVTSLRTDALPMLSLTWAGPNTLLAAGHNCVPFAFNVDGKGNISPGTKLEEGKGNAASGANSAMDMFKKKDLLGTSDMTTKLNTTHQNQVSELRHYSGDKASAGTISTVAGDGKLVLWDLAALKLKGLKI